MVFKNNRLIVSNMKNKISKFILCNCFLIATLTAGHSAIFAQPDLSPNQRYFDTTSNRLHETCFAFDGGYYSAKFSLISSESGFSMTLDNAELLASLANVRSLPKEELNELWALNDSERAEIEIKDCSSILVDWWGRARYEIYNLPVYEGQRDLQQNYALRLSADLKELEKGFSVDSACLRSGDNSEYTKCIGQNMPKLDPEHHVLIGSPDKLPPFFEEDYKQILSWLIEMGLGYDRFIHVVYDREDNNDQLLDKLRQIGLVVQGDVGWDINNLYADRSCLSDKASVFEKNRGRIFNFCNQPNPYTDPDFPEDLANGGDAYYYTNIAHNQVHEYFHHTQSAHVLDGFMGASTDCCGNDNAIEAPPFWVEGAAMVFPDLFVWEKFDDLNYTKRNEFKRGNGKYEGTSPIVCQTNTNYLCDQGKQAYQNEKRRVQQKGGKCYLGSRSGADIYDYTIRDPQCDWAMAAYYLAYITSFQVMWVDIARDMWALGFPASFEKHVGMNINEFAESYSEFMNTGSPEDLPPAGFFPTAPLSELVDFWELKKRPSGIQN
jgi:hypothetical protein